MEKIIQSKAYIGTILKHAHSKTKNYRSGVKDNMVIINPEIIAEQLEWAKALVKKQLEQKWEILIICEKSVYQKDLEDIAKVPGVHYFNFNTPSGVLTNFETLSKRIWTMNDLRKFIESKDSKALTKKEQLTKTRELAKVEKIYKWVQNLKKIPDLILIVDGKAMSKFIDEIKKTKKQSIVLANTDFDRFWDKDYNGELVITNVSNYQSLNFCMRYIFDLVK